MTIRKSLRLTALFLSGAAMIAGCAGDKSAKKDPFFEKWGTMAEESKGHSPSPKAKVVIAQEEAAAGREMVNAAQVGPSAQMKSLPSTRITLKLRQTDIQAALTALASLAGQNMLFSSKIKGELSIDFNDVPWDQAFNGILKNNGLTYDWEGDVLRIMTVDDLENDLKVSTIKDKRLTQELAARLGEPLVIATVKIDYADPKGVKDNLQELIAKDKDGKPRGSIRVDEHNNTLIIQAVRNDLNKMLPLIEKIDKPTSQILIKANIVETTKGTARDLGIQWGGMYKTKTGGHNTWITPGGSVATGSAPADPIGGGVTPVLAPVGISGQGFGVNFPVSTASATGAASLGLMVGTIGGNILDAQLTAMQKDGKLNILSSPSITTLDNQKAFTENGEKVPFVTTQTSSGTATQTVSFETAVLRLEITPHVIDGKSLKMNILVKKDEVDMTRQVQGNPFIIKKQTETTLIVQDGETIVISGLTKQRKTDNDTGVPLLKDIPLVGWLFRGSSKSDSMEEVLIFITPHILPVVAIAG